MAAFNVTLPNVLAALDELMPGNIHAGDNPADVASLVGQLNRQTARFDFIQGSGRGSKKRQFLAHWTKLCAPTVSSCTTVCDLASTMSTDDSTTYTIDQCKEVKFLEDQGGPSDRFRLAPYDREMEIAKQLVRHLNALDTHLAEQYIAFLVANKGAHEFTEASIGSANGLDWEVPANQWTDDLALEMSLAAQISRFPQAYILDGLNLYNVIRKAGFYGANDNGRGEAAIWNSMTYVSDPLKMRTAAADTTFVINPGSLALVTDNWHTPVPESPAPGHTIFSINSRNLPGVSYDVTRVAACSSNTYVNSWKIVSNYTFVINPEGCTENRTGILSYKKIAGI
jgi:hypothetical protein